MRGCRLVAMLAIAVATSGEELYRIRATMTLDGLTTTTFDVEERIAFKAVISTNPLIDVEITDVRSGAYVSGNGMLKQAEQLAEFEAEQAEQAEDNLHLAQEQGSKASKHVMAETHSVETTMDEVGAAKEEEQTEEALLAASSAVSERAEEKVEDAHEFSENAHDVYSMLQQKANEAAALATKTDEEAKLALGAEESATTAERAAEKAANAALSSNQTAANSAADAQQEYSDAKSKLNATQQALQQAQALKASTDTAETMAEAQYTVAQNAASEALAAEQQAETAVISAADAQEGDAHVASAMQPIDGNFGSAATAYQSELLSGATLSDANAAATSSHNDAEDAQDAALSAAVVASKAQNKLLEYPEQTMQMGGWVYHPGLSSSSNDSGSSSSGTGSRRLADGDAITIDIELATTSASAARVADRVLTNFKSSPSEFKEAFSSQLTKFGKELPSNFLFALNTEQLSGFAAQAQAPVAIDAPAPTPAATRSSAAITSESSQAESSQAESLAASLDCASAVRAQCPDSIAASCAECVHDRRSALTDACGDRHGNDVVEQFCPQASAAISARSTSQNTASVHAKSPLLYALAGAACVTVGVAAIAVYRLQAGITAGSDEFQVREGATLSALPNCAAL
jgi:hypothetical protein